MAKERTLIQMYKKVRQENEAQAPEFGAVIHEYYCTKSELVFLLAIRGSYLRFRREYWESDLAHEGDDVPQAYLESSDEIREGDGLLIDELKRVIRAWEEEQNDTL